MSEALKPAPPHVSFNRMDGFNDWMHWHNGCYPCLKANAPTSVQAFAAGWNARDNRAVAETVGIVPNRVECMEWAEASPEFRERAMGAIDESITYATQNRWPRTPLSQEYIDDNAPFRQALNIMLDDYLTAYIRNGVAPEILISEEDIQKVRKHLMVEEVRRGWKYRWIPFYASIVERKWRKGK